MANTKKVFPVRLTTEQHSLLEKASIIERKSKHQFILDAIENEAGKSYTYELMFAAYKYIEGSPANELKSELLEWLLENK